MPIDTGIYPISRGNALTQMVPIDQMVPVPTAKDIVDLSVARTNLESAKIRNRLSIMAMSDSEKERQAEIDRQNYLLGIGSPTAGMPGVAPGTPPVTGAPQPPAAAPAPAGAGGPNAFAAPGYPGADVLRPKPGGPAGADVKVPLKPPDTFGDVVPPTPTPAPTPGAEEAGRAATTPPKIVMGPADVQAWLNGVDLPKAKSYGEFAAQQQIIAERRKTFDEGHKRTMEEFKPIYQAIVNAGDEDAMKILLANASQNPFLTGLATYLKDIKLPEPGSVVMTQNLNQGSLNHLASIAANPMLRGIIENAPPGMYKVKTTNGKVTEFDVVTEKSETNEQLAERALKEEKAAKGDTTPVSAQEVINKMNEIKAGGKTKTDYEQARAVLKEQLGRDPSETEIEKHMFERKRTLARETAGGRFAGIYESSPQQKQIEDAAHNLVAGKIAPSMVKNTFGVSVSNFAINRAIELDPNYNAEDAEANYQWYKQHQLLIRRTESMIDPDHGAISEAIRLAKAVNQPAGTPINKITGAVGIALGASVRQVFNTANDILAEEGGQIFGSRGGGEKFLELARGLTDPNLSVEQYINAVKEMNFMILTRQMANVRGTPAQGVYERAFEKAKGERPFLTEAEKKKSKAKTALPKEEWVRKAKELNPGLSLDAIRKEYDKRYGGKE